VEGTATVIAIKDFDYKGRSVRAGEAVDMRPVDALVAERLQQVTLDKMALHTYMTRVMVAPSAAAPVTATYMTKTVAQATPSTRQVRKPRNSRRSDSRI